MADGWASFFRGPARAAWRRRRTGSGLALAAALWAAGSARAEPYVARAQLVEVKNSFVSAGTAAIPGAGVRAFQHPATGEPGQERFEIRWYANPPGIPPGAVILLETVQEHSQTVKNHLLRTPGKSLGHVRSFIEIPAGEIRMAGRVVQWRVRVIWRGRVLATQASGNWNG